MFCCCSLYASLVADVSLLLLYVVHVVGVARFRCCGCTLCVLLLLGAAVVRCACRWLLVCFVVARCLLIDASTVLFCPSRHAYALPVQDLS